MTWRSSWTCRHVAYRFGELTTSYSHLIPACIAPFMMRFRFQNKRQSMRQGTRSTSQSGTHPAMTAPPPAPAGSSHDVPSSSRSPPPGAQYSATSSSSVAGPSRAAYSARSPPPIARPTGQGPVRPPSSAGHRSGEAKPGWSSGYGRGY